MNSYHAAHLMEDPARRIVWEAAARHLARPVPSEAAAHEIGAGYCDWIKPMAGQMLVAAARE